MSSYSDMSFLKGECVILSVVMIHGCNADKFTCQLMLEYPLEYSASEFFSKAAFMHDDDDDEEHNA